MLFFAPVLATMMQVGLTGVHANLAAYNKVRYFKSMTLAGAIAFSLYQKTQLDSKYTYLNRFIPEPTTLQTKLQQEAEMYRANGYKQPTISQRKDRVEDPRLAEIYSQFYQLGPQDHVDDETDFNPPEHQEHWG